MKLEKLAQNIRKNLKFKVMLMSKGKFKLQKKKKESRDTQ